MEDKKLNEKESLELITQMIQNTRRNLDAGSGNLFLTWGYVGAIVTLVILAGVYWTKNPAWMHGFWAIPVLGYAISILLERKRKRRAKGYSDTVLMEIWAMLGCLCMGLVIATTFTKQYEFILPLCGLIISLGSIITGIVVRYKSFCLFSVVGLAIGLYMVIAAMQNAASTYLSLFCFVALTVFSMIIPGHMLNYAAKNENRVKVLDLSDN